MYIVYVTYSYLGFRPKRFGKTRLIFINCLKACNCCTLMDIIACFALPKTSLLFQKSSNYLYYSNPYFPRINRNIRACHALRRRLSKGHNDEKKRRKTSFPTKIQILTILVVLFPLGPSPI